MLIHTKHQVKGKGKCLSVLSPSVSVLSPSLSSAPLCSAPPSLLSPSLSVLSPSLLSPSLSVLSPSLSAQPLPAQPLPLCSAPSLSPPPCPPHLQRKWPAVMMAVFLVRRFCQKNCPAPVKLRGIIPKCMPHTCIYRYKVVFF